MGRLVPLVLALVCGGCYFARSPIRPVPALLFPHEADVRASCLVVVLPGLFDGPETLRDQHVAAILRSAGSPCDVVAVDATYRYYFGSRVDELVYTDVLVPALARGYERFWLVGVSLGGMGAIMTARAHPRLVEGVVLLSPFLGLDDVLEEIAASGLADWEPPDPVPPIEDANFTRVVWAWLQGYVTDPDAMPELFVGWAEGERVERAASLLGAVLDEDHVATVEGRHDWASWTALLGTLARRAELERPR